MSRRETVYRRSVIPMGMWLELPENETPECHPPGDDHREVLPWG